jgi:hypothetical protein
LSVGILAVASWDPPALANHTSCRQYDSGAGGDTYNGTDGCDEFWMRGGIDTVYAHDNVADDLLHMGDNQDFAYGQAGQDYIKGGDNGRFNPDVLKGGAAEDNIWDTGGNEDYDLGCGGDATDYIDFRDDDALDILNGGPHTYGHPDILNGNPNDGVNQNGDC